jgi:hypothetical protein
MHSQNWEKRLLTSRVCPFICTKQLGSHWMDFHDSWYLSIFWKSVRKLSLTFWHRSFTFNSNKSPTWYNNFSVYYPDICLQLNMFRVFSRPSWAQRLQWQPLDLPSYHGDSCAVFIVGPAGPTMNTARLSPRYEGKSRGCHCSLWAHDERENARNMLSCRQMSG